MEIISIRKGFHADHSSTSYEFYAVEKPLTKSQRERVGRLSSRATPTRQCVSFIYHGDWSDLPGGWEPLVEKYYDVMYSESYDWWTLAMAFDADAAKVKEIKPYAFQGVEDLGVWVHSKKDRVVIAISCRLDAVQVLDDRYSEYECRDDYYDMDEDEEDDEQETGDSLLELLAKNRERIKNGDYRLLYGVWQIYGYSQQDDEDEEEWEEMAPPDPGGMDDCPEEISDLLRAIKEES